MNSMDGMTGTRGPTGSISGMQRTPQTKYGVGPGQKAPKGFSKFQQFTPEMMDLLQQLTGMVGPESYLSRLAGGDEEMFRQIEQPALRQFGQFQSGIASRFSGQGMGGRHSSSFYNAQTAAGQDFASQLQAQRMGLQRQATMDLAQISQMLMGQRPYGLVEKPQKESSPWGGLIGAGLGAAGGALIGQPIAGASLGYGVGSQF